MGKPIFPRRSTKKNSGTVMEGETGTTWPYDLLRYLSEERDLSVSFSASNIDGMFMVQARRYFTEPGAEHPHLTTCKLMSANEFERSLMHDVRLMDQQLKDLG